jgi:hypothetical protein
LRDQGQARRAASDATAGLSKSLEDVWKELALNPHAAVGDHDLGAAFHGIDVHADTTSRWSELHRIGQQIPASDGLEVIDALAGSNRRENARSSSCCRSAGMIFRMDSPTISSAV